MRTITAGLAALFSMLIGGPGARCASLEVREGDQYALADLNADSRYELIVARAIPAPAISVFRVAEGTGAVEALATFPISFKATHFLATAMAPSFLLVAAEPDCQCLEFVSGRLDDLSKVKRTPFPLSSRPVRTALAISTDPSIKAGTAIAFEDGSASVFQTCVGCLCAERASWKGKHSPLVLVGNFGGDGSEDVCVVEPGGTEITVLGYPDWTVSAMAGARILDACAGKFSESPRKGVAVLREDGVLELRVDLSSTSDATPVPASRGALLSCDLDRDGFDDVLVYRDEALTVYYGGRSPLERRRSLVLPTRADELLAGDLNGDGRVDLVVIDRPGHRMSVVFGPVTR
jgi:hypothetical protein